MASDDGKKAVKPIPKNPRMASIQKRAEALTSGKDKPVDMKQFFQEAIVELKKTTWPNKAVLTKSTTVVLALVAASAIWVGALDFVLSKVLAAVTGR